MKTSKPTMALLALALCVPAAALADPPAPAQQAAAPVKEVPPASDKAAPAATEDRLEQTRGGDATVDNQATLSGVVSGNSAVNVTTGYNIIDSGSFANASGMPMVIQNSGANVLIQNATVINLQLK